MTPIFYGTVKYGKFVMRPDFWSYLSRFNDQEIEVIVRKKRAARSNQANRYYWGVVVKLLSDHTGYTPEEMHDALKVKFLGAYDDKNGLNRIPSTADMKSDEFSKYVDRVISWAAADMGVYIPPSTDVYY